LGCSAAFLARVSGWDRERVRGDGTSVLYRLTQITADLGVGDEALDNNSHEGSEPGRFAVPEPGIDIDVK
jgi:hypothetical protein